MNEELQHKVFSWVSQTADKIGEWGEKEIPAFITEFLTWRLYDNLISIGLYLIAVIIALIVIFKVLLPLIKWLVMTDYEELMGFPIAAIVALLSFTIFMFPVSEIKDCVKIKVAPKVYLVEEAAKLIK